MRKDDFRFEIDNQTEAINIDWDQDTFVWWQVKRRDIRAILEWQSLTGVNRQI